MDASYQNQVSAFLKCRRIAVLGYSTSNEMAPANGIFKKLKEDGYEVFGINPRLKSDPEQGLYPNLSQVPGQIEAAMICTPPQASHAALEACHELGISRAWIHRSVNAGSYDAKAEEFAQQHGISLLTGGGPMMFLAPDFFHKCIRWYANLKGVLKTVEPPVPA